MDIWLKLPSLHLSLIIQVKTFSNKHKESVNNEGHSKLGFIMTRLTHHVKLYE